MKESIYKTYDDLLLFLNATIVAQVLGISAASSRMVVPKEKFVAWVEQRTSGGST